jgi:hypothetical protein
LLCMEDREVRHFLFGKMPGKRRLQSVDGGFPPLARVS